MKILIKYNHREILIESIKEKNVNILKKIYSVFLGNYCNSQNYNNNTIKDKKIIISPKKEHNYISLFYNLKEKDSKNKNIKIFGEEFVLNNKYNCYMIYNNRKYNLSEYLEINNDNKEILKIQLKPINYINNLSFLFQGCSLLKSISNLSKLKTNNLTNMKYLFDECSLLESISDISKWNTNNITSMRHLFNGCSSLKSIPDISKWNTNNVNNIYGMFAGCSSLNQFQIYQNGI